MWVCCQVAAEVKRAKRPSKWDNGTWDVNGFRTALKRNMFFFPPLNGQGIDYIIGFLT